MADGAAAELESRRLWLAPVTATDAALMLAVWNDAAFVRNVGDRGIRTLQAARAAIAAGPARLFAEYGYGPFKLLLKPGRTAIGICGLFRRETFDDPDIGFALLPEFVGRGYAGEAADAVVAHARDTLGLPRLLAIVSPGNRASIGLIEKLGMQSDGLQTMPGESKPVVVYRLEL